MTASNKESVDSSKKVYRSQGQSVILEGLSNLWEHTLGDPEITVAVLDGPCDTTHPSLLKSSISHVNFVGTEAANGPAGEHGTHAASIIFGQHDSKVKGIAPQCNGLIIPIFRNDSRGGISACSQPDLARAIRVAANAGANVINISAGQFSFTGTAHPMLRDAVQECHEQGRLIVAATGNDGCACLHVPGALPSVLAVGAMDREGNPMEFSNWGGQYQLSGILAPGVNILGALPGGGVVPRSGTSFATPIVSGVMALLLSLQKKQRQTPSTRAVRSAVLESALGCEHQEVSDCRRLLTGRLNILGAISKIINVSKNFQVEGDHNMSEPANVQDQSKVERQDAISTQSPQVETQASLDPGPIKGNATEADSSQGSVLLQENITGETNIVHPSAIMASDCSCQNNGELVYAIGGLTVDFGTIARADSLQQSADTFDGGGHLNIRSNSHLLRHLLGWEETYTPGGISTKNAKEKVRFHKPHLYDAKEVVWVMTQDESPLYAIQPMGAFSEEGFFELAHFLMEIEGYSDDHMALDSDQDLNPSNMFTHPSLDTLNGGEPNRSVNKKTGRVAPIIERIAIPGRISGSVRLLNGMVIPVLCPNMRGTKSWNLQSILSIYTDHDPDDTSEEGEKKQKQKLLMERITRRLFEEARNKGISGEERALNFSATQSFQIALNLQTRFKVDWETDLESIEVNPSPTCRQDSECYDVNVAFFDAENIMRSKMVLRYTVDVSDEVPVLLGEPQHFRSR